MIDFKGIDTSMFETAFNDAENKRKERVDNRGLTLGKDAILQRPNPPITNAIVYGLPNDVYHRDNEYMSSSRLKALTVSEWHFVNYGKHDNYSSAFAFGNLVHNDIETRINSGIWQKWEAGTFKTKTTIKQDVLQVHETVMPIIKTYRDCYENDFILSQLLDTALAEVSFFDDERKLKVRTDAITQHNDTLHIFDHKTVASIEWFHKDIIRYGYDASAGMYADVVEKIVNMPVCFHFICICKKTGLTKHFQVSKHTLEQYKEKFNELYNRSLDVDVMQPKGYDVSVL